MSADNARLNLDCPLCEVDSSIKVSYRWYCVSCDALVKQANRKSKKGGHFHRTAHNFCPLPMINVKVAILCPHNYVEDQEMLEMLNKFDLPHPTEAEVFPTQVQWNKASQNRAKQREIEAQEIRKRVEAFGMTPVVNPLLEN